MQGLWPWNPAHEPSWASWKASAPWSPSAIFTEPAEESGGCNSVWAPRFTGQVQSRAIPGFPKGACLPHEADARLIPQWNNGNNTPGFYMGSHGDPGSNSLSSKTIPEHKPQERADQKSRGDGNPHLSETHQEGWCLVSDLVRCLIRALEHLSHPTPTQGRHPAGKRTSHGHWWIKLVRSLGGPATELPQTPGPSTRSFLIITLTFKQNNCSWIIGLMPWAYNGGNLYPHL